MQTVPQYYIDELEKDCRKLYCTVRIELGKHGIPYHIFKDDDILDYDITKELQEAGVPCAYLGQNVATIRLYNEDNQFKDNERYARFLTRGAKVKLDCTVQMPSGVGRFGPDYFVGWLDNYEFSDDGQFVTITIYDSLHYLKNQPSPWFRPSLVSELPFREFITYYLMMCGLEPSRGWIDDELHWDAIFNVDFNINVKLKPLIDSKGTVGDVLTQIAQVALCAIYCDNNDVLQIQLLPRTRHLVYTYTDINQVFSSASSTFGYSDYTDVSINVYDTCAKTEYSIKQTSAAYTGESTLLPEGATDYNGLALQSSTYPAVVSITCDSRLTTPTAAKGPQYSSMDPKARMVAAGATVYVMAYDFMMNTMNLTLWTVNGIEADIKIYATDEARAVGSVVQSVDVLPEEESFFLMKKTLQIDCPLMTDKVYAQQCANTYAKMISSATNKLSCSCRGMPQIELLDLVAITNPQAVHDAEQILLTRLRYQYNGALSCELEGMSYASVVMLTYAFLSPGMYIPYDAGATYITATCVPPDAGIVEGAGPYALGDTMRLMVVPRTGWVLDHWEDEDGNKLTDDARTYVAAVRGAAKFLAIMREDAAFITLTVDVTVDNPLVTIPIMSLTPATGTIDWGDGSSEDYNAQDEIEHAYDIAGTMTIVLRAPIENLAFEIFANNSTINTFTAGSSVAYIPNGMFYNSSVKNVNFLPAKNAIFAGSFSEAYGPSTPYCSIQNDSITGITSSDATYQAVSTDPNKYSNSVRANVSAYGIVRVQSHINGLLINSLTVNTNSMTHIHLPNTGLKNINFTTVYPNLNGISFNGPIGAINMYRVNGDMHSLNMASGVQYAVLNNITSIEHLSVGGPSPVITSLAKATSLTDIYLYSCEIAHLVDLPPQQINIHKPVEASFIVYGANNNVVVINDIT